MTTTPIDLVDEGLALYHRGEGFEAHEVWERVWREAKADPKRVDEERVLRALIKLAAAMVKVKQKQVAGVLAHAIGARELLEQVSADVLVAVAHVRSIANDVEANAHALVEGRCDARAVFGSITRV